MDNTTTDDIIMPDESEEYLMLSLPNNKSRAMETITNTYLAQLDPDIEHDPKKLADDLIDIMQHEFRMHNQNAKKDGRWPLPQALEPVQIAELMLFNHKIKNISFAGMGTNREYDLLSIYQAFGKDEGIYTANRPELEKLIQKYHYAIDSRGMAEVIHNLEILAERTERCSERDLIAVNNGIFDYKNKILLPFSPDYVFTAKSRVDYNPGAISPVIHNDEDGTDWEVEQWIKELFPDGSDIPDTIWQIMGALTRPNVSWNKAAWFVSEKGCNGKGTLCHLMRNLLGEGTHTSIQLADFGKRFALEPLIGKQAIITDENDVGTYIDRAANLKAVITGDVTAIERKFKKIISYRFQGVMIQCVNEMPRVKDKSESFYRRQLFIPFNNCYTGAERKYIKDDYLNRTDVLEYVLYRVLHMDDYYAITEPESCRLALDNYKTYNDPVRDFIQDVLPRATWGYFPNKLLYAMYKSWHKVNNPSGLPLSRNEFLPRMRNLSERYGWVYKDKAVRPGNRIQALEPLIDEFGCTDWMIDPNSHTADKRMQTDRIKDVGPKGFIKCDWHGQGDKSTDTDADGQQNTDSGKTDD